MSIRLRQFSQLSMCLLVDRFPALIFKGLTMGKKFLGWAKIRIEREIKTAVNEYTEKQSRQRVVTAYSTDDTIGDNRSVDILTIQELV